MSCSPAVIGGASSNTSPCSVKKLRKTSTYSPRNNKIVYKSALLVILTTTNVVFVLWVLPKKFLLQQ